MTDIQTLMSLDPLQCTDSDIMTIIEEFRKKKHLFNLGNMKAGSTKAPKLTKAETEARSIVKDLDLDL